MTPEFSRREHVDTIGARQHGVTLEATGQECRALAERFALVAIERLTAHLVLYCVVDAIIVDGRVDAAVIQACSVTGDPIATDVDEPVMLRFVNQLDGPMHDEIELDPAEMDTLPIEGDAIDLGEVVAETLALALDPFPRAPRAAAVLKAAGVIGEDEVRPFNAFAALGDKLR